MFKYYKMLLDILYKYTNINKIIIIIIIMNVLCKFWVNFDIIAVSLW